MIVYKAVDFFSQKTGKKIGTKKEFDFCICDFTGERIGEYENPNTYRVNHNDNDPCFGDGKGEEWLYELEIDNEGADPDEGTDPYDLFAQSDYIFKNIDRGIEVFADLLKAAKKSKLEIYSLDHLLRWSRGKMLEKVIKDGKYTLEEFSEEENKNETTIPKSGSS